MLNRFSIYHLYYILSIALILLGFFTHNTEWVYASWHMTIYNGYWEFIVPAIIYTLLTGITLHALKILNINIKKRLLFAHWWFMFIGYLLLIPLCSVVKIMSASIGPDTSALASNGLYLLYGPVILLISIGIFIGCIHSSEKRQS